MNEQNHLTSDQRGITLIEVIVSMLILAIIVVPLLSNFAISSRINQKSRTRQYATTLAQNVMEGMKTYDLAELTLQFNGVASGGAFRLVPLTSFAEALQGSGYYETDASFLQRYQLNADGTVPVGMSLQKEGNQYTFLEKAEKRYYYVMNNIAEGTKRFDVQITVDANGYDMVTSGAIQYNQFKFPDVTSLDVNETAIINPSQTTYQVIDGNYVLDPSKENYVFTQMTYDDKALDYYRTEHERLRYDEYAKEYAEAGPIKPTKRPTETDENLLKRISRKTIITIDNNSLLSGAKVSCEFEYTFHQTTNEMIYDSSVIKKYNGFYTDVTFSKLHNIYLFHTPLDPAAYWSDKADCIYVIHNATALDNSLQIFVAQQPFRNGLHLNNFIYVDALEMYGTKKLLFYYNKEATNNDLLPYNLFELNPSNYNAELVLDQNPKDRIYAVKVSIYEHGSSELLYELTSTVTR